RDANRAVTLRIEGVDIGWPSVRGVRAGRWTVLAALVAALVIGSYLAIGPPPTARSRRADVFRTWPPQVLALPASPVIASLATSCQSERLDYQFRLKVVDYAPAQPWWWNQAPDAQGGTIVKVPFEGVVFFPAGASSVDLFRTAV